MGLIAIISHRNRRPAFWKDLIVFMGVKLALQNRVKTAKDIDFNLAWIRPAVNPTFFSYRLPSCVPMWVYYLHKCQRVWSQMNHRHVYCVERERERNRQSCCRISMCPACNAKRSTSLWLKGWCLIIENAYLWQTSQHSFTYHLIRIPHVELRKYHELENKLS